MEITEFTIGPQLKKTDETDLTVGNAGGRFGVAIATSNPTTKHKIKLFFFCEPTIAFLFAPDQS